MRVAQRAANDNQAVLIELGIAGYNNLVVSHEADRAHSAFELDVHQTISEAFRKAEEALLGLRNIHAVNSRIARQTDLAFSDISRKSIRCRITAISSTATAAGSAFIAMP